MKPWLDFKAMQLSELNSILLNDDIEEMCPWLYGRFYGVRNDTFCDFESGWNSDEVGEISYGLFRK